MSDQITVARVDQFRAGIEHLAQQKMSRLRGSTRVEGLSSANRASFDQLGLTSMNLRTSRHAPTEYSNAPHARRWVIPAHFDRAELVDVPDKLRILNDPTNEYTESLAKAAGRTIDDLIISGATAAAFTGELGTTTTAYDTTMDVAAGGAGLTIDKILQAKEKLDSAEEDDMDRTIVCAARQFRDLLSLVEMTSADFNKQKALADGRITEPFAGFTFVRSQRLPLSGTDRACIYFQKSAILLGEALPGRASVDRMPNLRNSTQVLYQMDAGVTRMRETGVGRILCVET